MLNVIKINIVGVNNISLYEPEKEKERVKEIREMRRAVRHEKARQRKAKREKYKELYKTELAKKKAELQAEREHARESYRTTQAIEKARRRARARVRPFVPRKGLKVPSIAVDKERVKKGARVGGKLAVKYAKIGLKTLDKMYGGKPKPRKRTKRKTTKHKTYKTTARQNGKTYYCYKCRKRHSYTSKIGRKHKR